METSTTSSIVSRLGGGSGIDMTQLARDLAETRFLAQIGQLESRSEALQARISAASTLRSQITQLASALGDRIRNGDLSPSASLANPAVARVQVASSSSASGSYALEVQQLASAQMLAGNAYAGSGELVGEGTLTIRFGNIAGGSFTEDTGRTPATITVEATDTLADVAGKINASASGLTAYVAQTASGAQLVVKGETGEANGFVIEASGASASGGTPVAGNIDFLAWNPAGDSGQLRAAAQDAQFLFDTIAMSSASNSVTGLPEGLSLTLTQTNVGAPTRISFDDKNSAITAMMGDFTAALNDLTGALAELASPLSGELGNDPGARALKRELASLSTEIVIPNAAPGEPATLADLGLARTREGNFRLDADRLRDTLANNPAAAGAMFTTGLFGVFATIDNLAREVSRSTDPGSLGGSITRYTAQAGTIDERLEKIAEQQEALRERLVRQFAATDRNVTASQSTLSFLQNQIAAWNGRNGN
ncbi:flagellar filament capping protein FliD [Erythrobacter sp. EC-HK427]|uniref:flagellar filament capping protein FliD n=1 Tax=Erythrobacter sp. EC-HK427 TaxID=2038396 RepID=UPI0012512A4F|nr:flagellar filament capping protein FliD [Erythrobacter sp. EC-HK427]VVT01744.1 Flagellar hook-associated protein 2 [Erythrobacter sp. EC-HK427]